MISEKVNLTYKIGDLEVNRLGYGAMQLTGKGVWGEVPDRKVPVEETLKPVVKAMEEGKIKHVGLSEVNVDQIKQVEKIIPIVSVQNRYNLGDREWEEVVDYTASKGMAFIPWFPLASGPGKMAEKIEAVAKDHGATTAQIALAWLLKRSENILLIPGTRSIDHLEENLKAADIELTDEEFQSL